MTSQALPSHPDRANRTEVVRVEHRGYPLTAEQSDRLSEWVEEVFGSDVVAVTGTVDSITYYVRAAGTSP